MHLWNNLFNFKISVVKNVVTMKIRLYKKAENKNGTRTIHISISYKGVRCVTGFGVSLTDEQFDRLEKTIGGQRVKIDDRTRTALDLYNTIESECNKVEGGVVSGFINITDVDLLGIINRCKGHRETAKRTGLKELFIDYIKCNSKDKNLTDGTIVNLMKITNILCAYGNNIDEIATKSGLGGFVEWLQYEKKLSNTTCRIYLAIVKAFLRWAYNNGYCDNEFEKYKHKLKVADAKEKAIIYLTIDELQKIESIELNGARKSIRDKFLFQCYTGLRISDVDNLKWDNVKGDTIRVTTKKTGCFINKQLPQQAIKIIEEYKEKDYEGNRVFPKFDTATTGRYLKEVAKMAGITDEVSITEYRNGERTTKTYPKWQKLTTHVGRKTFVVLSLSMGFTANQVIKETGHSTIQALQPYIDITEQSRNAIADKWSELMRK